MKKSICIILLITAAVLTAGGQGTLTGTVVDSETGLPLSGATIKGSGGHGATTDGQGRFRLVPTRKDPKITISHVGYQTTGFSAENVEDGIYALRPLDNVMEEAVVSTGYQQIPKERATGSFTLIDHDLLNRKKGGDLLSRLEGVTSSLSFDRRANYTSEGAVNLRLRGVSTIYADSQPLIVLDNFPYEGGLGSINPEDIQDITVLKDAAAASIWGAKAANGVIVIKTKTGRRSSPLRISFTSSLEYEPGPDLFYSPEFLESGPFMEIEEHFFGNGLYKSLETGIRRSILSPFVERLIDRREGIIGNDELDRFREMYLGADIRKEATDYLFRDSYAQQYNLGFDGGSDAFRYYSSVNYNNEPSNVIGDNARTINIMHKNTYSPVRDLDITSQLVFNNRDVENNGIDYRTLTPLLFPYYRLRDGQGRPAVVDQSFSSRYKEAQMAGGLQDWEYRPLEELELNDNTSSNQNLILNIGSNYRFLKVLTLDLRYQHTRGNLEATNHRHPDSYYVRERVNKYTQPDGEKAFPEGGILSKTFSQRRGHAFRPQLGLQVEQARFSLNGLVGAEFTENTFLSNSLTRYAYDEGTLTSTPNLDYTQVYVLRPFGSTYLPAPSNSMEELVDRFVSYYGNASFVWDEKYIVSGSLRWDASNLFGVDANQRGVPLWSTGLSWEVGSEDFFAVPWLNRLRLRATYGVNGNLDKTVTAYPVARYLTDTQYGNAYAQITTPGNPSLTWEKVKVQNYGFDFRMFGNRLEGHVEAYFRKSEDLFGYSFIDPTVFNTGNAGGSYRINYADMTSKGIDIQLSSLNIDRAGFQWRTDLLFNWIENEVTHYYEAGVGSVDSFVGGIFTRPVEGRPLDVLYSYPWAGLDPETGQPLVRVDGEDGKEYAQFRQNLEMDDLVYHGLSVPPVFGSIRNTFKYKRFDFSFNIQYGFNYSFRRKSIDYYTLFNSAKGHVDYHDRWRQPGDEQVTQVPALPDRVDAQRSLVYRNSEILVERGDNLRLRDLVFGYTLSAPRPLPFKSANVSVNMNNLGFIWRKTKLDLDPDYPRSIYPPARTVTVGLRLIL